MPGFDLYFFILFIILTPTQILGCHSTCLTCNGPSSSNCTSCAHPFFLYNSSCVERCSNKTYADATTRLCEGNKHNNNNKALVIIISYLDCRSPCHNCTGPSFQECLSCVTGYYFLGSNTACYQTCPASYYAEDKNGTCQGTTYTYIHTYIHLFNHHLTLLFASFNRLLPHLQCLLCRWSQCLLVLHSQQLSFSHHKSRKAR